jgi:hypothetical protein
VQDSPRETVPRAKVPLPFAKVPVRAPVTASTCAETATVIYSCTTGTPRGSHGDASDSDGAASDKITEISRETSSRPGKIRSKKRKAMKREKYLLDCQQQLPKSGRQFVKEVEYEVNEQGLTTTEKEEVDHLGKVDMMYMFKFSEHVLYSAHPASVEALLERVARESSASWVCSLCGCGFDENHARGRRHRDAAAEAVLLDSLLGPTAEHRKLQTGMPKTNMLLTRAAAKAFWGCNTEMLSMRFLTSILPKHQTIMVRIKRGSGKSKHVTLPVSDIIECTTAMVPFEKCQGGYCEEEDIACPWHAMQEEMGTSTDAAIADTPKGWWPIVRHRLASLPDSTEGGITWSWATCIYQCLETPLVAWPVPIST